MTPSEPVPSLPWWRSTPALLALVIALGAALIGAVVLIGVKSISDDDDEASAKGQVDSGALVAAKQEALAFFSLDHTQVEADVAKVLALATGQFKTEYAANSQQVIDQVKQKKIVSVATIPDGGVAVESVSGDRAQILVVVDVDRKIGTKSDRLRNRARLVLEKVGREWLVSALNQVG